MPDPELLIVVDGDGTVRTYELSRRRIPPVTYTTPGPVWVTDVTLMTGSSADTPARSAVAA